MRRFAVLLLVTVLAVSLLPAKSPNAGQPTRVSGLKAAAKVYRDVFGIAHVRANHERDVYFMQGWIHAQDRLFQMDVSRRTASGTLAELVGEAALPGDVELRTLGLRRAAERSLPVISHRAREALRAYSAGVNAYVDRHPLPPEYHALELTRFEPWTPMDTMTVAKLIAFGLSFGLQDIENTVNLLTYQATGEAAGFDGTALYFADVFRSAPFTDASTVPDATGRMAAGAGELLANDSRNERPKLTHLASGTAEMGRRYLERVREIPFMGRLLDRETARGSNEWAISGEHTTSGDALLANDPHLALDVPTTFYPIHLQGGGLDVSGNGFAGVPFVVTGQNRFISWGATVNPMDVTDVYQEKVVVDPDSPSGLSTVYMGETEPIIPIPESYRVNVIGNRFPDTVVPVPPAAGLPEVTLIVPRRLMGPILDLELDPGTGVGQALSLQYTGFAATRELDTFLIWDHATDLDDFVRGLMLFDFGSQNFAYSDVHGNIAYFTSAEMPIREDLQAMQVQVPPYFIRDGQGGQEWMPIRNPQPGQALPYEILPFDEMPHLVNPPAGWFVNANNDPAGTTLDNDPLNQLRPGGGIFYLSPLYDGFRGGRITRMVRGKLAGGGKISYDDMQAMQADVALTDARFFTPFIVQAMANARADGAIDELSGFARDPEVVEAVRRLAAWDFTTPTGIVEGYDASDVDGELSDPSEDEIRRSVGATLYAVWRGQFIRNSLDVTLDAFGLGKPGSSQSLTALRFLLEHYALTGGLGISGLDFFHVDGVDDPDDRRDIVILASLRSALDRLAGEPFEAAYGFSTDPNVYRWGMLHRIVFDHPLGQPFSIPVAGGGWPNPLERLPGIPADGGFGVVDASSHNARAQNAGEFMYGSGPSNRFASAAGESLGMRSQSAWPGGTSGVLGSRFYFNLLPSWLTNDTVPLILDRNELNRYLDSVDKFVPAGPKRKVDDPPRGWNRSGKRDKASRGGDKR